MGCHAPFGSPAPALPSTSDATRGKTLGIQVLTDTAEHVLRCPVRSTLRFTTDRLADLWQLCRAVEPAFSDAPDFMPGVRAEPASLRLCIDRETAVAELEQVLDSAGRSVDVLMYLWENDALGWSLAERIARKAGELSAGRDGPAVRVLIDGGGNLIHGPAELTTSGEVNSVVCWLAEQPGVEVLRTRNPMFRFDHRKLVLIDGTLAWSGGRNFTLASFFEYRDLSYTLEGPLVREMAECFEDAWASAGGTPRPPEDYLPDGHYPTPNAEARVVGTGMKRRDLAHVLYRAVDRSQYYLYLENPYFTDNLLLCKLSRARRRGVDVRVVMAADSNSHLMDRAVRVTINRLLRAGVRVYVYPGTTHVKAAAADSRWAYIGTGNFDNLSLRRNHEIGLSLSAGPVIDELEQSLFLADFRDEWEVRSPLPVTYGDYLCALLVRLVL